MQGVDENLEPAAALRLYVEAHDLGKHREGLAELLTRYSVDA